MVLTYPSLVVIYRRFSLVYHHHGEYTSIYWQLSYPFRCSSYLFMVLIPYSNIYKYWLNVSFKYNTTSCWVQDVADHMNGNSYGSCNESTVLIWSKHITAAENVHSGNKIRRTMMPMTACLYLSLDVIWNKTRKNVYDSLKSMNMDNLIHLIWL